MLYLFLTSVEPFPDDFHYLLRIRDESGFEGCEFPIARNYNDAIAYTKKMHKLLSEQDTVEFCNFAHIA